MRWFGYRLGGVRHKQRPWWSGGHECLSREDNHHVGHHVGLFTDYSDGRSNQGYRVYGPNWPGDKHLVTYPTLDAAMAYVDKTHPLPKPELLAGQIWVDFDRRDRAVLSSYVLNEVRPSIVVAQGHTLKQKEFWSPSDARLQQALVYCPGGQAPWTRTDLWEDVEK